MKEKCTREFLVSHGTLYDLDYKLQNHVEIRRCQMCSVLYYAVPLDEWADIVQDSQGKQKCSLREQSEIQKTV